MPKPSLWPLHLHVISMDLDAPALKHRKHWNSFATPFFVRAAHVERRLAVREAGGARADDGAWHARALAHEDAALACHRCGAAQPSMPKLKEHVHRCNCPIPPALLGDGSEDVADADGL